MPCSCVIQQKRTLKSTKHYILARYVGLNKFGELIVYGKMNYLHKKKSKIFKVKYLYLNLNLAIILPGSQLAVYDFKKISWLENLINYLKKIIELKDCPFIFGSCFGA